MLLLYFRYHFSAWKLERGVEFRDNVESMENVSPSNFLVPRQCRAWCPSSSQYQFIKCHFVAAVHSSTVHGIRQQEPR